MSTQLLRHLGARRALRVLTALGRSSRPEPAARRNSGGGAALVQLLTGLAVVGSLIMAKTPSGTGPEGMNPHAWVEANKDRLPRGYDDLTAHSLPYRKAIFSSLEPDVRTQQALESAAMNAFGRDEARTLLARSARHPARTSRRPRRRTVTAPITVTGAVVARGVPITRDHVSNRPRDAAHSGLGHATASVSHR